MSELTHLSLFSGIGGLDIAGEWAGFRTVGQCEWADYPHAVLRKHWPDVPKWRDIRTLTKEGFYERTGLDTVTVVSGGFPCQPFSTAGKRRGKEDDRYLWPEMCRVISEIQPTWVVGENVAGLISMDLDTVLSDLEDIGYACQTLVIPACAVDAPHRRDRCAILAHTNNPQAPRQREHGGEIHPEPKAEGSSLCGDHVAYAQRIGLRPNSDQSNYDQQWYDPAQKQGWGPELCPTGCGSSSVSNATGTVPSDAMRTWRGGQDLAAYIQLFPTPIASDWKNRGCKDARQNRQCQLQTTVGGQLNPMWVEWLMGFPLGWTDLDASEMPSCPSSSTPSSAP